MYEKPSRVKSSSTSGIEDATRGNNVRHSNAAVSRVLVYSAEVRPLLFSSTERFRVIKLIEEGGTDAGRDREPVLLLEHLKPDNYLRDHIV